MVLYLCKLIVKMIELLIEGKIRFVCIRFNLKYNMYNVFDDVGV